MEGSREDEIRVLGPLEIVAERGAVALPALKERKLLAALVLDPGKTRSTDALVEALWGATPPRSAAKLLQVYVSKLRKALPPSARIRTQESGYALELADGALDAARFERLLAEGRDAARAGNPVLAASLLRRALSLWRGQAYGDLAYEEFARIEAERLEELRLVALEELIEAELELGHHLELLPELRSLASANPLREHLQAQLMLALYRGGRQSEALDVFGTTCARISGSSRALSCATCSDASSSTTRRSPVPDSSVHQAPPCPCRRIRCSVANASSESSPNSSVETRCGWSF
jgi:DNA-binding SARP family transcriptional activator